MLEKPLEDQKLVHEKRLITLGKEIGQLKTDLAAKDNILVEREEMVAAKDHEIEAKAKTIADVEQADVDVEALKKDLTLAGAKQRKIGCHTA